MNHLIKLSASWCQPCKSLAIKLNSMGVKTTDIDIESLEGIALAHTYDVMSVPALIVGETVYRGTDEIMRYFQKNGSI